MELLDQNIGAPKKFLGAPAVRTQCFHCKTCGQKKKKSIKNFGDLAKFLFTEIFNFFMKECLSCPFGQHHVLSNFNVSKGVLKDFRKY